MNPKAHSDSAPICCGQPMAEWEEFSLAIGAKSREYWCCSVCEKEVDKKENKQDDQSA